MKKVLIIGPINGGIGTFILNIFIYLKKYYKLNFIDISGTLNYKNKYVKYIKQQGGIVLQPNINDNYIEKILFAKKIFKRHYYDLVDLNTSTINNIFWLKMAHKYGIKNLIIHSHNDSYNPLLSPLHNLLSKMLSAYNTLLLKRCNIIKLAASKSCGKWMFDSENFNIIDNGINTDKFLFNSSLKEKIKSKLGINLRDQVVITTSRLEYQKNYRKILGIFYYMHLLNNHIVLVIIGGGSEWNKLHNLVSQLNLKNYVYFLGQQDSSKIPLFLNFADIMLMPSLYEGMPFSLIEAQAAGVPALVSDNISRKANITKRVSYLSLKQSNMYWARVALNILHTVGDINVKYKMNNLVKKSRYNILYSIGEVQHVYDYLLNNK